MVITAPASEDAVENQQTTAGELHDPDTNKRTKDLALSYKPPGSVGAADETTVTRAVCCFEQSMIP